LGAIYYIIFEMVCSKSGPTSSRLKRDRSATAAESDSANFQYSLFTFYQVPSLPGWVLSLPQVLKKGKAQNK